MAPRRAVDLTPEELDHSLIGTTADGGVLAVRADNFRWLPDGSVDLILTDPPYAIAQETNFHTYEKNTIHSYQFDADKGWDTYGPGEFIELLRAWSKEFFRVLRPGGAFAVFCADQYLSHLWDALEAARLSPKRTFTWRKPNAVPINRQYMPMSACEYIVVGHRPGKNKVFNADIQLTDIEGLTEIGAQLIADKVASVVHGEVQRRIRDIGVLGSDFLAELEIVIKDALAGVSDEVVRRADAMFKNGGAARYLQACVPNFVQYNSKGGRRLHPTEKPEELLRFFVALYSRPGDVVLDPFGGSGAHAAAARSLGRNAVIVERDGEFFSKLTDRLGCQE